MSEKEIHEEQAIQSPPLTRRLFRYFMRVVKWLGIFIFVLLLIFQLPALQNYLAQSASQALSKKLGATVAVDCAYLSFFNHLTLEKVYVEDLCQDTLLFVGELTVDFSINPITIYRKGLVVEEIGITNALFNLHQERDDPYTNLQNLLQNIPKEDKIQAPIDSVAVDTVPKEPFHLAIKYVALENFRFHKQNEVSGNFLAIFLSKGAIYLNEIDLAEKIIDIQKINFSGVNYKQEGYTDVPLPDEIYNEWMASESANSVATPGINATAEKQPETVNESGFRFLVREFRLVESKYSLDNYDSAPVKITPDEELDLRHFKLKEVEVSIDSFQFYKEAYTGTINKIAALTATGFQLSSFSVKKGRITPKKTTLTGVKILTPYSEAGDTIIFRYREFPDFKDFVEKVRMDIRIHDSNVALRDIMVFAPKLEGNEFFVNNRHTVVKLAGRALDKISNLRVKNFDIALPDGSLVEGDFESQNIMERTQEFVILRLSHLHTHILTLRQLIPSFNPPATFNTLGELHFTGNFAGFFANFVADGKLRTNIGTADMDMNMNLLAGRDKATYEGTLKLFDFDLGKWAKNDDFGLVNLSSFVKNGSGLTANTATANLETQLSSFFYKGYNYQHANFVGELNQNLIDGNFAIKDDNIDFSFDGKIDYTQKVPKFEFNTAVKKLDLQKLHLSKQNISLAGNVHLDLQNQRLADLVGSADVKNFYIQKDDERYNINSITIESDIDINNNKTFVLLSEVMGVKLEGNFQIDKLPATFATFFTENYAEFTDRLYLKKPDKAIANTNFTFDVNIIDSKGLNWLLDEKLGVIKNAALRGHFSSISNESTIYFNTPTFEYGHFSFGEIILDFEGKDSLAEIKLEVEHSFSNGKLLLPTFNFEGILHRDSLDFGLTFAAPDDIFFDNLGLKGHFYLPDSTHYGLSFNQENLTILTSLWNLNPNNQIIFNKEEINIRDFEMTNGNKTALLTSKGDKMVNLDIVNLDFHYIDEIWVYDPLDFFGHYNLNVNIQDVFKMKNISAVVRSDSFLINGDNYGQFQLDLFAKNIKSRATAHLEINKNVNTNLIVDGFYNLAASSASNKTPADQKAKYLDFKLNINNYPLDFARYFIAPAVKNITGRFDIEDFRLKGSFPNPEISGKIIAKHGAFTIDYLKTRYSFDKSLVTAKNDIFDASGTIIYDKYGHEATVSGGIIHDHLRNLGVDAFLSTDRFLALDTKKEDNNLFYGQAIGDGEIYFEGLFSAVDIYVNASVDDSTHIILPISYDKSASALNSINFVNKHTQIIGNQGTRESSRNGKGVALEMDLSIRDEALMELIFNEKSGEIIKGKGNGNIRLLVPRDNEFQMFGDYTIAEGNYLFAYSLYLEISKDFRIKEGGTIHWDGDPFGAQINLAAEYKNLSVPPANFIQEYLSLDPDIEKEARNRTKVDLTLLLNGDLLKPEINFDLNFPQTSGQLATVIDNKLRQVRADENELNRQVFGLLILGQFFPSDFAGANVIGNTINNTLEEFVSNQFSLLVNNLFSEWSEDYDWLAGTNIDFDYQSQSQEDLVSTDPTAPVNGNSQDVALSFSKRFNDRFSIEVGGNVGFGYSGYTTGEESGTFVGDDIVIEYVLNKNRTLKLRFYQKLEPDIAGGRRFQLGTGLSWRKEFNSFSEFIKSLKKGG